MSVIASDKKFCNFIYEKVQKKGAKQDAGIGKEEVDVLHQA